MLTEIIDLPSKGNLYPEGHPLSDGTIEIKHMTAKDEDILTTESYIKNDVVIDKLMESVIVTDVDIDDIIVGDKQKILLQTRILAYGSEYEFTVGGENHTINLSELDDKGQPESFDNSRFVEMELSKSKRKLKLKILNHGESRKLQEEIKVLKAKNQRVGEVTIRLAHVIEELDGNSDEGAIREFVMKEMLASESLAVRLFLEAISPDVDFTVNVNGKEVDIPIGINFLYPSAKV